jgi:hypothetical protein
MLMTESTESKPVELVKHWSTWVITSKTSPTVTNDPLDQVNTHSWSTHGQNPGHTPLPLSILQNFCRVLQISPKHFKISQYKSCPVFRGTQLCFWVAFQIWSVKGRKTWSTTGNTIHPSHENQQLCLQFMLKWLIKI